jgi:hypothetical protein
MNFMWFGRELNEAQGERPGPEPDHTEPAPSKRVNTALRDQLTEILLRWVTAPDRYTEVAATPAFHVASYCDTSAGADGWRTVADQWLQPGALARRRLPQLLQPAALQQPLLRREPVVGPSEAAGDL